MGEEVERVLIEVQHALGTFTQLLKLDGITPDEEDRSLHSVTERLQEGREAGSAVVRGDVVGGNHGQGRHAKPVHGVVGFMIVAASR